MKYKWGAMGLVRHICFPCRRIVREDLYPADVRAGRCPHCKKRLFSTTATFMRPQRDNAEGWKRLKERLAK